MRDPDPAQAPAPHAVPPGPGGKRRAAVLASLAPLNPIGLVPCWRDPLGLATRRGGLALAQDWWLAHPLALAAGAGWAVAPHSAPGTAAIARPWRRLLRRTVSDITGNVGRLQLRDRRGTGARVIATCVAARQICAVPPRREGIMR